MTNTFQFTELGVVMHKPDHLSGFVIDKPTIDFFKQAQQITTKLRVGERKRNKVIEEKIKRVSASVGNKQETAKVFRK